MTTVDGSLLLPTILAAGVMFWDFFGVTFELGRNFIAICMSFDPVDGYLLRIRGKLTSAVSQIDSCSAVSP